VNPNCVRGNRLEIVEVNCRIVLQVQSMGAAISSALPPGAFRRIVLKPNWVRHEESPEFPIAALVTSSDLIDAVISACIQKYPSLEEIVVGDVPLQSCNWELLVRQAGIDKLIEKYSELKHPIIRFCDLRRERFEMRNGYMDPVTDLCGGDPKGYYEIDLGEQSYLEEVSHLNARFRVSDYDPSATTSSHQPGRHRYLIAASALDCDLFINLPKLKTHQKSGITGALKNVVGINGQKAYLVHHREGGADKGGDEFPPNISSLIILQTRLRSMLQGRSRTVFSVLRKLWLILRRLRGIQVEGTKDNLSGRFYIGAGSWYGNDSIWRMVYDLNRIVRYARANGRGLCSSPQRQYLTIMDAIIAGEGNGPLQPIPVPLGALIISDDPFLADAVAATLMGFDYRKIPLIARRERFGDSQWGRFKETCTIDLNGECISDISAVPVLHRFVPPPGWRGYIEANPPVQTV
jgi:uncharacterized protein (DUF362 family)